MGDIFNSVGGQMWGTFSTLWLIKCGGTFSTLWPDKCGTHFQLWREQCGGHFPLCGGNNVEDIFNSVAGQNVGDIFSSGGITVGTFSTLSREYCGAVLTLFRDECGGHFQLCVVTNAGQIFNSVVGKFWERFSTLWLDKCG